MLYTFKSQTFKVRLKGDSNSFSQTINGEDSTMWYNAIKE